MMKKNICNCLYLVLLFTLCSCTAAKSQTKRDKKNEYQEDISSYRLKYDSTQTAREPAQTKVEAPLVPENDISKKLNTKLDSMSRTNSSNRYASGFRVLVYSGKSTSEVQAVKSKLYQILPDINIYPQFKSPNQIIKVGDCLERTEAYALLGKLKKQFPNAVIVPDQVIVKTR